MRKNPKNDMRKQERLCLSFPQFFEIARLSALNGVTGLAQRKPLQPLPTIRFSHLTDGVRSGFADGRNEVSPDSEQIEHTGTTSLLRNSVSVEQIQDGKDRSGIARVLV